MVLRYGANRTSRGVAQLGRALRSGRRGRGFKSRHPDQHSRAAVSVPTVSDSLFEPGDDGWFHPTGLGRGPWSPHALHGGPVAALVAQRAEAALAATGAPAVEPVRLTIGLDRPVPLAPLRVEATIVRPGKKVQTAAVWAS